MQENLSHSLYDLQLQGLRSACYRESESRVLAQALSSTSKSNTCIKLLHYTVETALCRDKK